MKSSWQLVAKSISPIRFSPTRLRTGKPEWDKAVRLRTRKCSALHRPNAKRWWHLDHAPWRSTRRVHDERSKDETGRYNAESLVTAQSSVQRPDRAQYGLVAGVTGRRLEHVRGLLRAAYRDGDVPGDRDYVMGFRLARSSGE